MVLQETGTKNNFKSSGTFALKWVVHLLIDKRTSSSSSASSVEKEIVLVVPQEQEVRREEVYFN